MQSDRIPNETKAGRQHELEQLQPLQQRRRRASDAQKPICFPFALRTELPPPAAAPQALGGLLSTRGFSDDTHDDFKAKANAEVSDVAASIQADIDKNNVMVYMKGVPAAPMCGFSNTVCRVLDAYGACPVLSSHPPPLLCICCFSTHHLQWLSLCPASHNCKEDIMRWDSNNTASLLPCNVKHHDSFSSAVEE